MNTDYIKNILNRYNIVFENLSFETIKNDEMKEVYILNGIFKSGDRQYDGLIIKRINYYDVDELNFYNENHDVLKKVRPEAVVVDTVRNILITEKIDQLFSWDNKLFKSALQTITKLHGHFWNKSNIYWISNINNSKLTINNEDIINALNLLLKESKLSRFKDYYYFLIQCYKRIKSMESLLFHNSSLLHGDLHYINSGLKNGRVLLFDWSTITYGNVAYDISYLLENTHNEKLMDKSELIDLYLYQMAYQGVKIDKDDFTFSYYYTYIYRVITSILPIYFGRYLDGEIFIDNHIDKQIQKIKKMYDYIT